MSVFTTYKEMTLTPVAGLTWVQIPLGSLLTLFGTVLKVCREGKTYDIVYTTPGERQVMYNTISRRLIFRDEFNADETVYVLIKLL